MEDCEPFTRRFFYERADIESFKTMVVMGCAKAGFSPPLPSS